MHTTPHNRQPNRLIKCISPYLLQHAYNPVEWYPWCTEAFDKANKENKPIFLSIGYSTCHWCHVMAHESFEDIKVAQLLKDTFVCIKVDREERPDIDATYMKICQMMTSSGGWPLTIFMTPDKQPFFAGTYFPKATQYGNIGMLDLIPRIKEIWTQRHEEVIMSAQEIVATLKHEESLYSEQEELTEKILDECYQELNQRFDSEHGGFSSAPKFPTPHTILFLLRYWKRTGKEEALQMVEKTLSEMRNGGIFDHLGCGFHRYATDQHWKIPHFEKMLYDQALIALAYLEAYQATHHEEYATTAHEIFTYVLRDMTSREGAFYSAEDADTEGVEGKYYLWSWQELTDLLTKEELEIIAKVYNCTDAGNVEGELHHTPPSTNILYTTQSLNECAGELHITLPELKKVLDHAQHKLLTARNKRIRPGKDTKILTDWNGLMIAALAHGAKILCNIEYADAAQHAADYILKKHFKEGKLLHCSNTQNENVEGMLDDYAFLTWGLLEVYEATFNPDYLKTAQQLTDYLLKHFWDTDKGGLYLTADTAETILVRQKEIYDGALPSGNAIALLNLFKLAKLLANKEYEEKAQQMRKTFADKIMKAPSMYTQFLCGVDFLLGPYYEIVITGKQPSADTQEMLKTLNRHYLPSKIVLLVAPENQKELSKVSKKAQNKPLLNNRATAYICTHEMCKMPTNDTRTMLTYLDVKTHA